MKAMRVWLVAMTAGAIWGAKAAPGPNAIPQTIPKWKAGQIVVASRSFQDKRYLAFPVLLRTGPEELLLGYKRGESHYRDREAYFEVARFNPVKLRTEGKAVPFKKPGVNLQNGEFARFPNGEIACYIDAQAPGSSTNKQTVRLGLLEFRSLDGGRTWQDCGKLGIIEGVEYGYAFEAVTEGATTRMLVMTFSNLPGGMSVYAGRSAAGAVHVIRSDNNGRTWHFVNDLSRGLGNRPINESSFAPYRDGYIVTCRGYDNSQWLALTDAEFRIRRQVDLAARYPNTRTYLGRPRLFARDGFFYLLGRNYTPLNSSSGAVAVASGQAPQNKRATPEGPMRLGLFRFDPETLELTKHVILDNAEGRSVADGYYAAPYWQQRDGQMFFDVITYKRADKPEPDIIRLSFDWNEVR